MSLPAALDHARKAVDPIGYQIGRAKKIAKSLALKDGEGSAAPVAAGGAPDPTAGSLTTEAFASGGHLPPRSGVPRRRRHLAGEQTTLKAEPPKVAVAVVMDANGNLLTVRQPDGSLALPGGWLLDGEPPDLGAARECREETGFPAAPVRVLFVAPDEDGNVSAAVECQLQGNQGTPDRGELGQVAWLPPADLLRETKYPRFNAQAIAAVSGERAAKKALTPAEVTSIAGGTFDAGAQPLLMAPVPPLDAIPDPLLIEYHGLELVIDRPAGFVQTKLTPEGTVAWTRTYSCNYGFLPSTCGGDEDELDCFVAGPIAVGDENDGGDLVYWFSILDDSGAFDEYKLVFSARDAAHAREIILAHIPEHYVTPHHAVTTLAQIKALLGQDPLERESALVLVAKALEDVEPQPAKQPAPLSAKPSHEFRVVSKAAPEAELRFVLGVVLEPEVVDAQGEVYSADVIRESAWRWLASYRNVDLQHKIFINDKVDVVESWIAPQDMTVGEQPVKAGTWLLGLVIKDDELWAAVKRGELSGLSINGLSRGEPA